MIESLCSLYLLDLLTHFTTPTNKKNFIKLTTKDDIVVLLYASIDTFLNNGAYEENRRS